MHFDLYFRTVFNGHAEQGQKEEICFRKYWSLAQFVLIEPYRYTGNIEYYNYLFNLGDAQSLAAELSLGNSLTDIDCEFTRSIMINGIYFLDHQHPDLLEDFLDYAEGISSDVPGLEQALLDYRTTFSYGGDVGTFLLFEHHSEISADTLSELVNGAKCGHCEILYIGDQLNIELEVYCLNTMIPIHRAHTFEEIDTYQNLGLFLQRLRRTFKGSLLGNSVVSSFDDFLKWMERSNMVGAGYA